MRKFSSVVSACMITFAALHSESVHAEESASADVVSAQPTGEWSFSIDVIRPGDDLFWDDARGGTVKYTMWKKPGLGLAFSAGIQNWGVNEEINSFASDIGNGLVLAYAAQLEGDAQMIPISALGVWRQELSPTVKLNLEAGLSYVIVNSDVQYVEAAALGNRSGVLTEAYATDVDIDNGIVAVFAADLQYKNTPDSKWTFFAGVGGQADVSKGEVVYPFTPISGYAEGENELKGLFVRFGVVNSF